MRVAFLSIGLLLAGSLLIPAQNTVGHDLKKAGENTKDAAKKGTSNTKKGVKKGTHKVASETDKGANKVKEKTSDTGAH